MILQIEPDRSGSEIGYHLPGLEQIQCPDIAAVDFHYVEPVPILAVLKIHPPDEIP
jgi:hypothetical protein